MKRVVGGMVFQQGESGTHEFVEDGDDDSHFGFAIVFKAVSKGFESWIFMTCDHGWHEQDTAKVKIALGANASWAVDGRTALVFARGDAHPSGGGP